MLYAFPCRHHLFADGKRTDEECIQGYARSKREPVGKRGFSAFRDIVGESFGIREPCLSVPLVAVSLRKRELFPKKVHLQVLSRVILPWKFIYISRNGAAARLCGSPEIFLNDRCPFGAAAGHIPAPEKKCLRFAGCTGQNRKNAAE